MREIEEIAGSCPVQVIDNSPFDAPELLDQSVSAIVDLCSDALNHSESFFTIQSAGILPFRYHGARWNRP